MMTSYDDVMRTIVEIPAAQLQALDAWCRGAGVSRAEGVRRAVARQIAEAQVPAAGAADAFGLWRGRAVDGVAYERLVREEWTADAGRPGTPPRQAPGVRRKPGSPKPK